MIAADLAWAATRGHVTLLDEYRFRAVRVAGGGRVSDGLLQRLRVAHAEDFIDLATVGEALGSGTWDRFFAAWATAARRQLSAAPACEVTGEPADDCDHIDLDQVELGGEG